MSVLDQPLAILDVETTGMSATSGRVIEVAALRIENNKIVAKVNTLINPETYVDSYIRSITGIDANQLEKAPIFSDIAQSLLDLLEDAIFIAHNVRFDYSFIKNEFGRLGKQFKPRMLCTVRLSRELYPQHRRHSLDSLISRHNIKMKNRHRAYDDALAVWEFIKIVQKEYSQDIVDAAISKQIRRPSLPAAIDPNQITNLPDGPGVYVFEDEKSQPLYIGKSINIKKEFCRISLPTIVQLKI